jgi:putative DNA primase/helicase
MGGAVEAARPAGVIPDMIPAELRAAPQWVVWRWLARDGTRTKVLYRSRSPRIAAKPNDPRSWGGFDAALFAYLDPGNGLDGIGFVFGDDGHFWGFDLDRCLKGGEVLPWARRYLERLSRTYGEISPSGTGIKFIGRGRLVMPGGKTGKKADVDPETGARRTRTKGEPSGGKGPAVEVYNRRRFFTVTSQRYGDVCTVEDLSAEVQGLIAELWPDRSEAPPGAPRTPTTLDDRELLERARSAGNGAKFSALYDRGDWRACGYCSPSEADLALASLLAFWTGPDPARIERLVSSSALGSRDKWDRADYRQATIASALDGKAEFYRSRPRRGGAVATVPLSPRTGDAGGGPRALRSLPLTDLGNAERMVRRYGDGFHYCHPWRKPLVWDGTRWKADDVGESRRLAKRTVRSILREAAAEGDEERRKALIAWAISSERKQRLDALHDLAMTEASIPVVPSQLDVDPWLLNCRNGTIDLRTGELRPHDRRDLLTKVVPLDFDPTADCPLWEETLRTFLLTDDLIDFVQRLAGMAITGVVEDHVLAVAYGSGANGKSTILGTLIETLGPDYAMKAAPDLLVAKKGESHPTDRADLFGKRLVVAIETAEGQRLDESLVKELTGGDRIRAPGCARTSGSSRRRTP